MLRRVESVLQSTRPGAHFAASRTQLVLSRPEGILYRLKASKVIFSLVRCSSTWSANAGWCGLRRCEAGRLLPILKPRDAIVGSGHRFSHSFMELISQEPRVTSSFFLTLAFSLFLLSEAVVYCLSLSLICACAHPLGRRTRLLPISASSRRHAAMQPNAYTQTSIATLQRVRPLTHTHHRPHTMPIMSPETTHFVLKTVFPILGVVLANAMAFSPVPTFLHILETGQLHPIDPMPIVIMFGSAIHTFAYAMAIKNPYMYASNGPAVPLVGFSLIALLRAQDIDPLKLRWMLVWVLASVTLVIVNLGIKDIADFNWGPKLQGKKAAIHRQNRTLGIAFHC